MIKGTLQAQCNNERRYKQTAEDMLQNLCDTRKAEGEASSLALGQKLLVYRFPEVLKGIEGMLSPVLAPKRGVKPCYTGILQDSAAVYKENPERLKELLGVITLAALINYTMKKTALLSVIARSIGSEIQDEVEADAFIQQLPEEKSVKVLGGIDKRVNRHYKSYFAHERMRQEGWSFGKGWTRKDLTHLGCKLIEVVIDATGFFELDQAKSAKGDTGLEVYPTQWFVDTWSKNESAWVNRAYRTCPTVIPPAPWRTLWDGGYFADLKDRCSLLRAAALRGSKDHFSAAYAARLAQVDLTDVKAAINTIQETPWKINQDILTIIKQVIEAGGGWADIPRMEPLPMLPNLQGEYTEQELKDHKKRCVERIKKDQKRRSLALRVLANVKIAGEFADYEQIFFPHNMDFRGRVYSIPSFGPQGDDINKALLLFSDAPPVKSWDDIEWMKVHGANLAGVDKVSFADRRKWVDDHETQIIESAKDPLGYRWWSEQDDSSWQLLAFCFEWKRLKEYLKEHNGNPVGFQTGLAVAFDGTCSGLQHFSAILRDPIGGEAVNLVPGEAPRDIYRVVADKVNERLKKDAMTGTPDNPEAKAADGTIYMKYGTKSLAQQWLAYGVTRKVTKRPVMTLAYGAKEYGYREQIYEDTIKPAKEEGRGEMFVAPFQAAGYLAKLIWACVQTVVVKAVEGMAWLQKVAQLACKGGNMVSWVTPMNLPVQQGYLAVEQETFRLRFGGVVKRIYSFEPNGNVDKRTQVTAIAPNFIHSMDAAHLQRTVLNAKAAGLSHFAMIHDSYGTTVAGASTLYKVVRETFRTMYETHSVLEDFLKSNLTAINHAKIPDVPKCGTLDLSIINNSEYMFA